MKQIGDDSIFWETHVVLWWNVVDLYIYIFAATGFLVCSLPLPLMVQPYFPWLQHLAAFLLKCQAFLEVFFSKIEHIKYYTLKL